MPFSDGAEGSTERSETIPTFQPETRCFTSNDGASPETLSLGR